MKQKFIMLENLLHDLTQRVDDTKHITEIKFKDNNICFKIYNIEKIYYISVQTLEELLLVHLDMQNTTQFINEVLNIFKCDLNSDPFTSTTLELIRIEHITENVLDAIYRKYNESITENEMFFNKIDTSYDNTNNLVDNISIKNEYPFESNWENLAFTDNLQSIYKSVCVENINSDLSVNGTARKYNGRGKCKSKQEDVKDRPFICEYIECKRAFKRFEHLKRHNKMHTGERPYSCSYPGCMKAFSRSDNLAQHYKIHNVPSKPRHLTFKNHNFINRKL